MGDYIKTEKIHRNSESSLHHVGPDEKPTACGSQLLLELPDEELPDHDLLLLVFHDEEPPKDDPLALVVL